MISWSEGLLWHRGDAQPVWHGSVRAVRKRAARVTSQRGTPPEGLQPCEVT